MALGRPSPVLIAGVALCALVLLAAILAPVLAPYPYDQFHIRDRFAAPCLKYLAGTDEYGRDVLSRVLLGSRLSLALGGAAAMVSMVLGVPLGLVAEYRRGWVGEAIVRAADLMMSFPPLLLVLLLLAVTPPGLFKTALAIGLLFVPAVTRLTRSLTVDLVQEEFIEAARARGERAVYIALWEIMPNIWPMLLVEAGLRVVFAVLTGSVLSFLGFGVQPPAADWGLMISAGRAYVDTAPWIALAPGIALGVTVAGVNLLGDGLRARLDPVPHGAR